MGGGGGCNWCLGFDLFQFKRVDVVPVKWQDKERGLNVCEKVQNNAEKSVRGVNISVP
jgi:hypothetical protein